MYENINFLIIIYKCAMSYNIYCGDKFAQNSRIF